MGPTPPPARPRGLGRGWGKKVRPARPTGRLRGGAGRSGSSSHAKRGTSSAWLPKRQGTAAADRSAQTCDQLRHNVPSKPRPALESILEFSGSREDSPKCSFQWKKFRTDQGGTSSDGLILDEGFRRRTGEDNTHRLRQGKQDRGRSRTWPSREKEGPIHPRRFPDHAPNKRLAGKKADPAKGISEDLIESSRGQGKEK